MAGSIIIPILTGFDSKGIKDAESALASLGGKVKSFGRTAATALASYAVGAKAVDFVQSSASAAMDLQRNMTGVASIFGDAASQVQGFISSSEQLGMSNAQAAKAVTFLGSVFKQTGMPMDQVIEKTKTMVSLGADLAATYGYSVEEALTAMTATFRGEYDPIEKFGVAMKQQQVNAVLAERGLKGLTGSALIAAQQQIRYEMILQRTTDTQGAFQRSSKNLFQQQQILNAEFTDLKATLGMALIPALVKMAETLKPIISGLAPRLAGIFTVIGDVLMRLAPLFPKIADLAVGALTFMAKAIELTSPALIALVDFLVNSTPLILGVASAFASFKVLSTIVPIVQALRVQYALLKMELREATLAQVLFNGVSAATPWGAIAAGVGLVATAWIALANGVNNYNNSVKGIAGLSAKAQAQAKAYATAQAELAAKGSYMPGSVDQDTVYKTAYKKALVDWYARYQAKHAKDTKTAIDTDWKKILAKFQATLDGAGSPTGTSKVATWFQNLATEVEKQTDRLKLVALGLSAGLADSLLNASDWKTAVAKVLGMTSTELKKLQADFAKTSAGQSETEKAAADLADRTQKFVDAVAKRIETIKSLTGDLGSFMPKTLTEINSQIGQFESDVVSAADTLKRSLTSALDNKSITSAAYQSLTAYANREIAVLQKLAAQRDVLAKKIEAAKSIYLEVAQAVRGYGNITSTTTSQVTESYKKIIDGVEVTVTRTVEALQNSDLVATYKNVVDKTKAFLTNLTSLKKMGLNQTLFKQIIDAGVDAGGATAEAIVAGGQDTVSSLNDMFTQLDAAGAQMADLTAQVMQDNGITIVSAFIDGLTSQEQMLSDAAKSMAQIFSDAFNNNVRFVVPTINSGDYGLTAKQGNDALVAAGVDPNQGGSGKNDFNVNVGDFLPKYVDPIVPPEIPTPTVPTPEIPTPTVPTPEIPTPTVPTPEIAAPEIATAATEVAASVDKLAEIMAAPSVSGGLFTISQIASTLKAQFGSSLSQTYFEKAVTNAANGIKGSTSTMQMWTQRAANLMNTLGSPSDMPAVNTSAVTSTSASGPDRVERMAAMAAQNAPVYNVTVNAGLGTDGASVGQTIVKIVKEYERNNGAVWQAV